MSGLFQNAIYLDNVEEGILARAIEGGAFDEVLDWAVDSETPFDIESELRRDQEWWQRLADVAEGILGRTVSEFDIRTASSRGFWDPINLARSRRRKDRGR